MLLTNQLHSDMHFTSTILLSAAPIQVLFLCTLAQYNHAPNTHPVPQSQAAPSQRVRLGMLPTPLHRWQPPGLPDGVRLWVKRDDLSGMQLSGNKVRYLGMPWRLHCIPR